MSDELHRTLSESIEQSRGYFGVLHVDTDDSDCVSESIETTSGYLGVLHVDTNDSGCFSDSNVVSPTFYTNERKPVSVQELERQIRENEFDFKFSYINNVTIDAVNIYVQKLGDEVQVELLKQSPITVTFSCVVRETSEVIYSVEKNIRSDYFSWLPNIFRYGVTYVDSNKAKLLHILKVNGKKKIILKLTGFTEDTVRLEHVDSHKVKNYYTFEKGKEVHKDHSLTTRAIFIGMAFTQLIMDTDNLPLVGPFNLGSNGEGIESYAFRIITKLFRIYDWCGEDIYKIFERVNSSTVFLDAPEFLFTRKKMLSRYKRTLENVSS